MKTRYATTPYTFSGPVTSTQDAAEANAVLERRANPYLFTGEMAATLRRQSIDVRGYMRRLIECCARLQMPGDTDAMAQFQGTLAGLTEQIRPLQQICMAYTSTVNPDGVHSCEYYQFDCETAYNGPCSCALPGYTGHELRLPCVGADPYFHTAEITAMAGRCVDRFVTGARELGFIIQGRTLHGDLDPKQTFALVQELVGLRLAINDLAGTKVTGQLAKVAA